MNEGDDAANATACGYHCIVVDADRVIDDSLECLALREAIALEGGLRAYDNYTSLRKDCADLS
jgi:hypothetical protein